jgi:hypothetical protein
VKQKSAISPHLPSLQTFNRTKHPSASDSNPACLLREDEEEEGREVEGQGPQEPRGEAELGQSWHRAVLAREDRGRHHLIKSMVMVMAMKKMVMMMVIMMMMMAVSKAGLGRVA